MCERASGSRKCERIYLGNFEVYREYDSVSTTTLERETLHVMDSRRRVALLETKTSDAAAPAAAVTPLIRLQLDNHLQSAVLELDHEAAVISYEEYYPFGSSSYQAGRSRSEVSRKRYRYTGKERDEETGLYYHGARYYAPWLGRWTSPDPAIFHPGTDERIRVDQSYVYVEARPTIANDPDGRIIWFIVLAAVVITALTATSAANAPTNAEQAAHGEKAITDTEYAAHVAVNAATAIAGGGATSGVLESTGSKVLAYGVGGAVTGGTSAPLNRAVSDVAQGHTSTPADYAKDTAVGVAVGATIGVVTGGVSRLVKGPARPGGGGGGGGRGGGSSEGPANRGAGGGSAGVRVRTGIRAGSSEGGGSGPPKSGNAGAGEGTAPAADGPRPGTLPSEAPTPPLGVRAAPQITETGAEGIRAEWGPGGNRAMIAFRLQGKGVSLEYIRVNPSSTVKGPQLLADALKAAGVPRPEFIESTPILNKTISRLLAGTPEEIAGAQRILRVQALSLAKALGAKLENAAIVKNQAGNWVARVTLSY